MNTQELVLSLKKLVADLPEADQRKALCAAAGFVAGYSMPLFADGSELTPEQLYIKHHQKQVRDTLGDLNNLIVIDLATATELARNVWVQRYRLVHEPFSPAALSAYVASIGPMNELLSGVSAPTVTVLCAEFLNMIQGD